MAETKPILISGGGLAAMLLAKKLLKASVPFIVFERDASLSFRAQGYRLRQSAEGLDAIEEVLGPDEFPKFWDTCSKTGGGGLIAIDAITGEEMQMGPPGGGGKAPNEKLTSRDGKTIGISRGDMRSIFMAGCEDHVQWSHHVTGYELTDGGVHAIFADGSKSVEGAMLIGGEGIYSKVAKQLSKGALKTFDTGARGIHGQAPASAYKGLEEGVYRIVDDSREQGKVFIITNVRPGAQPDEPMGWTLSSQPGIIEPPGGNFQLVGKQAADLARELTSNWAPHLQPLFKEIDEGEAAFWKITCSSPSGVPQWRNEPRVTVIGDAVHSMTPAGGIGANTAVRDSALLGRLIAEAGGYKDGITAAYEKEMRVYGSEAVATSYGFASSAFGIKIDEDTSPVVGA